MEKKKTVQEIRFELDGTYLHMISFGSGKKNLIILSGVSICGLEGMGQQIASAYAMFSREYTVYVADRKRMLPLGYTSQEMAEDVYRALKAQGVTEADVYGVSQGGQIAQCMAIRHPEFVHKMVLCVTQCRLTDTMREVSQNWQRLAAEGNVVALNRDFFERVYSEAYLEQNAALLPELEKRGTTEDCVRFEAEVWACEHFDVTGEMTRISCPVLVIGAGNDRVVGTDASYEIAQRLGCECFIYEGCSHAVFDEVPEIKERIYAFLQA